MAQPSGLNGLQIPSIHSTQTAGLIISTLISEIIFVGFGIIRPGSDGLSR